MAQPQPVAKDPWESASEQASKFEKKTFRANEIISPAKELTLPSCQGVVLNIKSQVRQIWIENPSFCDFVELGENQIAIIGKSEGETRLKIEFQDSNIRPMLFHVNVKANDPNSKTLSEWECTLESKLNLAAGNGNLSIFLFQNRIFVKGKLDAQIKSEELMSFVQKDFVRMKKENPDLKLPGISDKNHKMILVNMLTAN